MFLHKEEENWTGVEMGQGPELAPYTVSCSSEICHWTWPTSRKRGHKFACLLVVQK